MHLPSYSLPLSPSTPGATLYNTFAFNTHQRLLSSLPAQAQEALPTKEIEEAKALSYHTTNPFLRHDDDEDDWDGLMIALIEKGFRGRDLFSSSLADLAILYWAN